MRRLSPAFARKMALLACIAALAGPALFALDTSKLKPTGYVNDFANVLSPQAKQELEAYCSQVEQATGAQMAIVLVPTLDNEPVDDVANRLYREWGIGKKGKDEGLLILLATQDHKDRAEIGYGLEPIITDGEAGDVLRGIRPILRQGNYGGALLAAAEEFGQRIAQAKGVALGPGPRRERVSRQGQSIPWPILLGGFFLIMWLIGKMSGGGRGGGGGTGLLTGLILGNMMGRGSSGWGGGGFGGSGGGGGGGWGGFGGGDSGGGGASGGW